MDEPAWAEIQRTGAIAGYVLPLAVGIVRPDHEHAFEVGTVEGTGFLVAGGRGLGVTAKHVINALLAKAPLIVDYSTPFPVNAETCVPLAMFFDDDGGYRSASIVAVDPHPSEDVALFRLLDHDFYSPYSFTADRHDASGEYSVWGYPDEVRYDYFTETQKPLNVPLIFNGGYIRRRMTREIPPPGPLGRNFYELSTPAGSCCSGAPVSIRTDPWRAIGVYVGERRQPDRHLSETDVIVGSAVGYATRADALVQHWPQLFGAAIDLAQLCPLPPDAPEWPTNS